MRGLQHKARCGALCRDGRLFLRVRAPEYKRDRLRQRRKPLYDCVREDLPAEALMARSLPGLHSQTAVEQKHPPLCPRTQIAAVRRRNAAVSLQLRENIPQRRRQLHAGFYRKRQSIGLSRLMIRILSQDHDPHRLRRRKPERGKQRLARRINCLPRIRLVHPLRERRPVRLFKFLL